MIGKWGREVAGASARRNVRYALGYMLGANKEASRIGYWAVIDESIVRPDRGVGVVWEPVAGNGVRPAAIFCANVSALATADLEMQLVADANPLLRSAPTMHLMISHDPKETTTISNAEVIAADIETLNRLGLGDHQYVISVHRDVANHVHSHIVIGKCHPDSLRIWDSWRHHYRLPWALRETEIALRLNHDNGAAVVFNFEDRKIVRWAPTSERVTWHRERLEERLESRVRRYLEDHTRFSTPKSWARDRVGVAVAKYLSKAQERGTSWRDADVHLAAAEKGARLESVSGDRVRVTIMERVPEEGVAEQRAALISADASLQKRDALGDPIELYVPAQRPGATVELSIQDFLGFNDDELRHDSVVKQIAFMRQLVSADESEQRFIDQLRRDPSMASSELIAAGRDVFSRDDIASFIASRVTDPKIVAELCDLVETHDVNLVPGEAKDPVGNQIRMLSADTEHFSYTTKAQVALHNRVDEQLRELISKPDPNRDEGALQRALRRFEAGHLITLDPEQRQLIGLLTRRWSVVDGKPGTGKTVAMEVTRLYAEEAGRPIIGLAVTDRASRELSEKTGIPSQNIALALTRERMGKRVIPKRAIVVIDESSQPSYGQLNELFAICRERECSGISIGGSTQLGPIEAGFPHGPAMRIGKEVKAFTALTRVRRQRGKLAWLARNDETGDAGLIYKMDEAISNGDREAFSDCILELCKRGLAQPCPDRDTTIAAAVEYNLGQGSSERLGLFAGDNITGEDINSEMQGRLRLVGTGQCFKTAEHGEIELTKRSRIAFLKNARLGDVRISNGDTGTVTDLECDAESGAWLARVELDDSRVVSFNPGEFKAWNLGWALTIYKTQSASFRSPAVVIDKNADPRSLFTALSRAVEDLRIFYNEGVYPTPQDFAEGIAEKLRPHLDAQEIDKIEALTGGGDTVFAQRMRKAAADDSDPLHIRHEEYNAAQRAEYMKRARGVDQKYETLITQADPTERDRLRHELRSEKARLHKRFARISFPLWLSRERDGIEREVVREHQMRNYAEYSHDLRQKSHTIEEPTIRIDVDEPPSSGLKLV